MRFEKIVEILRKSAKEKGANSAKLIPTKDIVVEDQVRLKCRYGCGKFAKCFTCPPYAPTPDETRKILKNYSQGLLVEVTGLKNVEEINMIEIMYQLEREAFLKGLDKAFTYVAGPCHLCAICPAEKAENSNEFIDVACFLMKESGGILHFYQFSKKPNPIEKTLKNLEVELTSLNWEVESVNNSKIVKYYSPKSEFVVVDLKTKALK